MDHPQREYFLHNVHPGIERRYLSMRGKSERCRYEARFSADVEYCKRQARDFAEILDYVERFFAGKIPGLTP